MNEGDLDKACSVLLDECVRLTDTDDVLIVYDRFGSSLGEAISEECDRRGLPHFAVFVSLDRQRRGKADRRLLRCISGSSAIITALSAADAGTGFRIDLIDAALEAKARIVHMPGLEEVEFTSNVLGTDFSELHRASTRLFEMLRHTDRFTVRTETASGKIHTLKLRRDSRPLHTCGGIATPCEIINFPTGEVYFAPIEGKSSGTLVLNGSAENCIIGSNDEVTLRFEDGLLQVDASTFAGGGDIDSLRKDLEAARIEHPCSMTLCEFGIGTNSEIKELCGENVVDEKSLGTAHIAVGGNSVFDGRTICPYHHDLVFYPLSVEADGEILDWPWGDGADRR